VKITRAVGVALAGAVTATWLSALAPAAWAEAITVEHLTATVAADGTVTIGTSDGEPATEHWDVTAATYLVPDGWDGNGFDASAAPQTRFAQVRTALLPGQSQITVHVKVPGCGPYQVDAAIGISAPHHIYYPQGTPRGLAGHLYAGQVCESPSPSPSQSPSQSPSESPSQSPSESPSATPSTTPPSPSSTATLPTPSPTQTLPHTGGDDTPLAVGGIGLGALVAGALALALGRRPSRRH
jgi:LPXTG-motif cell wall-anchored protein